MGGRVSRFRVGREGGHIITDQEQFLDCARALFFPALQPARDRALWIAKLFSKHAALRPACSTP